MKRPLLIALLLMPLALQAQNHQYIPDTAALVVDRYLDMLNHDHLPSDSMLVIETDIYIYGLPDTLRMKRWFAPPEQFRVEVRYQGNLETGLITDGEHRLREYVPKAKDWAFAHGYKFHRQLSGYDFRGPLYNWRANNNILTYLGKASIDGSMPLDVVKVECNGRYTRLYMFEPSGLLAFIVETDEHGVDVTEDDGSHIDWKCIHEYQPVSNILVPSQESFQRDGAITVMQSRCHLELYNEMIFKQD